MTFASLPWSLRALVFAALAAAESFPYNPTKLLSATNSTFAYLLQPSSQSPSQGVLKVVNIGNGFSTTQFTPTTITTSLPFLKDDILVPYTPVIDASGNITVIAGSCTAGSDRTEVWRFTPNSGDSSGSGTWIQHQTSDQDLAPGSNLTGSNFLSNGVAFSPIVDNVESELGFYLFGGMCPFSATDATTWVSDAAYSNTMLQLLLEQSDPGTTIYNIQSIASRGPAIAEAGFTLTGLTPTYSMNSTGQVHGQQQDFLLLGGHTQGAFINMSNIALFSLPQGSWAFAPVQQPSGVKTDLAARQQDSIVEPRSGHTAVLSEDGASVIVFGGWVGDVSNPAQPQLAVLHLGSEYGGDASQEWTWSIPTSSVGIAPAGDGIYGHGAVMLPGGVMMVVGGYSISSALSDKSKRAEQTSNDNVFLYNTTSNSWIDSYAPPASFAFPSDSKSEGPLSKTSQQAGLGVGLGVGTLVLAGLCCFYLWYRKHLKKEREDRERALLADASQISFMPIDQSYVDRPGIDGRGGDMYAGHHQPEMAQAGSTGLWTNIPSPTRGLRNGLSKRPYMYHAAPRYYDERRLTHGSGYIHPILESEDERSMRGEDDEVPESDAVQKLRQVEDVFGSSPMEPEQSLHKLQQVLRSGTSSPVRDPFADPEPNPLGSHPVSPVAADTVRRVPTGASRMESVRRRPLSAEMGGSMNWMIVDGADEPSDPSSSSNGRSSPSRTDDRTSSTLSEASQRSHASSTSITRTMSTRTGALLSAALALGKHAQEQDNRSGIAATEDRTSTMGTLSSGRRSPYNFDNPYGTTQNNPLQRSSMHAAQKSADSFSTARTSFTTLQDQGQALLGGRPMMDRDDPYHRAMAATGSPNGHNAMQKDLANTPTASSRRGKSWVGSIRRAITAISNDRSFSFTGSAVECYDEEPRTSSSSPTRPHRPRTNTSAPRRAASDGGALLRQKRGETDWKKDKAFRDDPDPGDWGERRTSMDDRAAENEWDVEGAASKRDVQVMFTVPKARLRVVNADIERASMRSVSDSAMSRTDSIRNLRRAESINTVRSRTDGEGSAQRTQLHPPAEEEYGAQTTAREV